ncbi:hypothetical protein AOX55_00004796 (plasmid) [Sinorhizobium fredii CCBAU 25509]|nr:hypothetical protein SF83666_b67200 [Sinorhizobium fredii CCBAU 83666]AWM27575.1 hypothetical protein AOX55_00004796 [Sinorhizobium fredii CCBAU 25509]
MDWLVETGAAITADLMVKALGQVHENLRKHYPRGSASVLLIHATGHNSITVFHSDDCVLGKLDTNDGINWQTSPHIP